MAETTLHSKYGYVKKMYEKSYENIVKMVKTYFNVHIFFILNIIYLLLSFNVS